MGEKKFVGFGFGPIQSGLMLYEAIRSGNFKEYVIAEIDQELVDAIRANNYSMVVNVAYPDRIAKETIRGFWIGNPNNPDDRVRIAHAIGEADEMATAIPSVAFYAAGGAHSIASLLSENINPEKPQILYASENNNYAAELLTEELGKRIPPEKLVNFQVLDTVIGKMSGVKQSSHDIEELELEPIVPGIQKAVLVEKFNKIYISKIKVPLTRGITVFEEKEDLIPFEEAKLFGHNAIHSLLGYLASARGYRVMSDIRNDKELYSLGRKAFIGESGEALIKKHGHIGDPLFTKEGYTAYADDLLERMTNPFLHDEVERICRDPKRKLNYNDRIIGTMREILKQEITPSIMALAAVAGLRFLLKNDSNLGKAYSLAQLDDKAIRSLLEQLWDGQINGTLSDTCIDLIVRANSQWNTFEETTVSSV